MQPVEVDILKSAIEFSQQGNVSVSPGRHSICVAHNNCPVQVCIYMLQVLQIDAMRAC